VSTLAVNAELKSDNSVLAAVCVKSCTLTDLRRGKEAGITQYVMSIGYSRLYCYTSTQNTWTQLVLIASHDIYKYALFTNRLTNQSIVTQYCLKGNINVTVDWWSHLNNIQVVYDHADDRRLVGCIVAKPYVVRHQQRTMLCVYFIQKDCKIHKFCVEV